METIISAAITGAMALIGVILTNAASNQRVESEVKKSQAVTDTKLEELTREVRLHNNFAQRVPVIEEQIRVANHRIEDLENQDRS